MNFALWYPTIVTLGNGNQVVMGGRSTRNAEGGAALVPAVPELYNPRTKTWRVPEGARDDNCYRSSWWYPRAFLTRRGAIVSFRARSGELYESRTNGAGSFRKIADVPAAFGRFSAAFPAAMYEPSKVLALSNDRSCGGDRPERGGAERHARSLPERIGTVPGRPDRPGQRRGPARRRRAREPEARQGGAHRRDLELRDPRAWRSTKPVSGLRCELTASARRFGMTTMASAFSPRH